ncbi:bifunctional [glutamate--ammonia ligase]-adenylyl-L-tyrosine phosphorylase/[glutamate--ammonia-ligase] adenylyltransferase [Verrucomicrobiota bacterium sgz303538]
MKIPEIPARFVPAALDPVRVERALLRLQSVWPDTQQPLPEVIASFVDQGAALAHLLAVSPISVDKLCNDPGALVWLSRPEIHAAERGYRRMQADYQALRAEPGFDQYFRALRRMKQREMLRIALREVAGWSSVENTTLELTILAELCLRVVCDEWLAELSRRWGQPQTGFAVLGMGKFGGQELNYSSDIDVIFFYGDEGQINLRFTHQEFFTRFAEKVIATFSATDQAGPLFRIDLRLRPEGSSGPLVRSLESMENYYAGFGETWERMALIKARLVAGDPELEYEFTQRLQPFIFPRTVTLDVLEEIRAIKGRIEREIVGQAHLHRNVKLGHGGIREIEFIAQTLQILHGARHAFLQERSTLKALRALRELDFLPYGEMEALIEAYRFLRTVEHRLQIENEAQTHTLPERPEEMARLAASLALSREQGKVSQAPELRDAEASAEPWSFSEELQHHTSAVRGIFDRVLAGPAENKQATAGTAVPSHDLSFFHDPGSAERVLAELEAGPKSVLIAPRTRRLYARLEPQLIAQLQRVADPDVALTRFVRFVERYGLRGLLFETLLRNPRVLELLVRLFDSSQVFTEIVLRRPQLIEEVARGQGLGESLGVRDYLAGLARNEERLPWNDWVRVYRRAQSLRIGLRDVLGFATVREVQAEFSALAEACVVFVQRELGFENELTVIAMGKFGGRELGYGADLDVVFLGENTKAAAELIRAMKMPTPEGAVFSMDARLRPEGDAGLLALPLPAYETYFEGRAQMWEAQALTKARTVSGPQQAEALETIQRIWRRFARREDLFAQISAMHARVVAERAGPDAALDFKTGAGGLMQVEFFAQAHQMRADLWETNTIDALAVLADRKVLPEETAGRLSDAYLFLRRIEAVLRRAEEQSVSQLPRDEEAQRKLAIRCGFSRREKFLTAVQHAREAITSEARLV